MKFNLTFISANWGVWVLVLIGIFMVQGCGAMAPGPQQPSLEVKTFVVGDCNNLETLLEEDGSVAAPGACHVQRRYSGKADYFWNMDEDKVISPEDNKVCNTGSQKCRNPGGTCNGRSGPDYCYNTWRSGNSCFCACGQL